MRQLHAYVILGAVAHSGTAAAGSLPRGVGPEFAKFYDLKDNFQCIGQPGVTIPASQVNDNSCDCPDGSDEPGTAACGHLDALSPEQPLPSSKTGTTNTTTALPGFWCSNEGHIGAYVPFMFVNDGVCDYELCCDGSEEYAGIGGVKCPNKCGEIGKEWRRVDKERQDSLARAMKRKQTMLDNSKKMRQDVEAKIATLATEVKSLEAKEQELKQKLEEVERQERGKVVKNAEGTTGKLGVLAGQAKARVGELRDTLTRVNDERSVLQARLSELEGILAAFKVEYNPNFNDEGVKKAVRGWEDYAANKADEALAEVNEADILSVLQEDGPTSGINWAEFENDEEVVTDTDVLYSIEAYLPEPLRQFAHDKLEAARLWMIDNGIISEGEAETKTESKLVKAARDAHRKSENDLKSKNKELEKEYKNLDLDFGPDDIFRSLKGECVKVEAGEYTYELCWMESTKQNSKKGHASVGMGKFNRVEFGEADEEDRHDGKGLGSGTRMVLKYENGQGCWNGPNRRTDVWLACAEKEELWRVAEMEKCVYKMEVGTPAACGLEQSASAAAAAEGEHVKDEL